MYIIYIYTTKQQTLNEEW